MKTIFDLTPYQLLLIWTNLIVAIIMWTGLIYIDLVEILGFMNFWKSKYFKPGYLMSRFYDLSNHFPSEFCQYRRSIIRTLNNANSRYIESKSVAYWTLLKRLDITNSRYNEFVSVPSVYCIFNHIWYQINPIWWYWIF